MLMEIEAVKQKHEDQVMSLPNVIGIGVGEKAGKPVIKVLVTMKVPESSLRSGDVVPKVLDGYETDVEEIGTISAQPD